MQFVNLTPFHSQAFSSLDPAGNACKTVVTKVGYQILIDPNTRSTSLRLLDEQPLPLCMSDEHWDDNPSGSTRLESDLAPFKPRCDLLIIGSAYAPEGKPAAQWPIRVCVTDTGADANGKAGSIHVDKTLYVSPPGVFRKGFLGWKLERDKAVLQVPLRWERAFGGTSQVANPAHQRDPSQPEWLLNEACFSNPVGCGWIDKRYPSRARKAGMEEQTRFAAPSFFYPKETLAEPLLVKNPPAPLNTRQMGDASERYGCRPAGLGSVGRSWAPRVALTGTYDEQWQQQRWPLLPVDFDEHYWNCAPLDQQFPWPAPDCQIETWFLFSPEQAVNGYVPLQLPGHRAFVMAKLTDGTPIPYTAAIDTLILDTDAMQLSVVWRCRITGHNTIASLQSRFEIDPQAPLLKWRTGATAHA